MIERCTNYRRFMTQKPPYREGGFCAVKGADYGCGGYSDHCPKKLRKHFTSERNTPRELITFDAQSTT